MKNYHRTMAVPLLAAMLFSSCSMFTASGRRESAYARYVRKSSLGRVQQQKHFQPTMSNLPATPPSEPVESSGPEAVRTSDS